LLGRSLFDFVDREKLVHFLDRLRASPAGAQHFGLQTVGDALLDTVMTAFREFEGGIVGFILAFRDVTQPARSEEARDRRLTDTVLDLRGLVASIRSLSESLLEDSGVSGAARPLLRAIHSEAVRLSDVVTDMGAPDRLGIARPPRHFEEISLNDLVGATLRRLGTTWGAGGVVEDLEVELGAAGSVPLRVETSTITAAVAHLLVAVRARTAPARAAWLRARRQGHLVQLDIASTGPPFAGDADAALDAPVTAGMAGRVSVRDIVQQHAGEVWAYAGQGRAGFCITLPVETPTPATAAGPGPVLSFVGAGMVSGVDAGEAAAERPDFYDFSLVEQMERHLPAMSRDRELGDLAYVVLDTETTGLDAIAGDRIVSLGGVWVRGGAVKRSETFDILVNPGRPIPAGSIRFHGITDAMVADAPPIAVVLPAFLRFAEGAVLVGHQVWFDVRFLEMEAERLGLSPLTVAHPVLDTVRLSEVVHGPLPEHGLEAVARRLGVGVRGRHSALGDALTTAEVLVRLLELLKRRGVLTLGQAMDATRRVRTRGPR
jgi:DNA polymerase-3 subunit epsilon